QTSVWTDDSSDNAKDSDKNKDRDWLMHNLCKYGHHIRNLAIHRPMVLEAASMVSSSETGTGGNGWNLTGLTLDMCRLLPPPQPVAGELFGGAVFTSPSGSPLEGFGGDSFGAQAIFGGGGFGFQGPPPSSSPPVAMSPVAISEPLFPGFVDNEEFIQPPFYNTTVDRQKADLEKGWTATQYYCHLILSNPSLGRLNLRSLDNFSGNPRSIMLLAVSSSTTHESSTSAQEHHSQTPDQHPDIIATLNDQTLSVIFSDSLDILSLFPTLSSVAMKIFAEDNFDRMRLLTHQRGSDCVHVGHNLRKVNVMAVGN
ncbi:hypothetical protein BGZ82_000968, partial [Podila clonocystis]